MFLCALRDRQCTAELIAKVARPRYLVLYMELDIFFGNIVVNVYRCEILGKRDLCQVRIVFFFLIFYDKAAIF